MMIINNDVGDGDGHDDDFRGSRRCHGDDDDDDGEGDEEDF